MSDTTADRVELARLEQEWMSAMQARDMDRLEEPVADRFRFTAIPPAPGPLTRQPRMSAAREGYTIVSFAYEHMDVEVFGDTGVIHARYSQVANFEATNLSNVFRLTDIWARQD